MNPVQVHSVWTDGRKRGCNRVGLRGEATALSNAVARLGHSSDSLLPRRQTPFECWNRIRQQVPEPLMCIPCCLHIASETSQVLSSAFCNYVLRRLFVWDMSTGLMNAQERYVSSPPRIPQNFACVPHATSFPDALLFLFGLVHFSTANLEKCSA
jgi:hypothetical protein